MGRSNSILLLAKQNFSTNLCLSNKTSEVSDCICLKVLQKKKKAMYLWLIKTSLLFLKDSFLCLL